MSWDNYLGDVRKPWVRSGNHQMVASLILSVLAYVLRVLVRLVVVSLCSLLHNIRQARFLGKNNRVTR